MNEILVSVIIPAYNCAATLAQALDSVLQQQVPMEVLVINDGSPEDLGPVMQPYLADPRVVYLESPHNLGVAAARNRGVELARGNYVAFLDSDDYWEAHKLTKQLALMERTGCVLCATARELMTPEGRLTGRIFPVDPEITFPKLCRHNQISCSSVLIRTEVAREFPMHHDDGHEDYLMWLEILKRYGKACGLNEPLLKYRLSATGKSGSKLNSAKMTYKTYRYAGFGPLRAAACFASYAVHGLIKYSQRKGGKPYGR